ncbi:MAG: ABC transporter permease [Actinomycetota bacterium]|nr:ABC transporter permease [Actinomycetota bacterium]
MALSGRFRSALVIGGQGIRARKLRTFLSMTSLFLGVLAVVTVQASSEIASRALLSDIELNQGKDGSMRAYLPAHEKTIPVISEALRGQSEMVGALSMTATLGEPNVASINPGAMPFEYAGQRGGPPSDMVCDSRGCFPRPKDDTPPAPGQAVDLQVVGLTGDIRPFRPLQPESGQWLDFRGEPSLSPGLVVNREAAKGLTQYRVPAELRIEGAATNSTPRIIGVVHDGGSQPTAYARADEIMNWAPNPAAGDNGAGPGTQLLFWPSATDLEQSIKARLVAEGMPGDQWFSQVVDAKKQINEQLTLMRLIFLGMAALVLLIGVAGILNVGLATVGERVEEFALRRAVGTPRMLLAGIVLAETLIIGLLTAGAAVGVGVVGLELAGQVLGSREPMLREVAFPWQAGVAGVIAGVVAGVLGGLFPAIRAARIPIATVMRA